MEIDCSKTCRICLKGLPSELILLFHEENRSVLKKLLACADVTAELEDALPKCICSDCLSNLDSAYNFKIQCEYMDRKLRENLESSYTITNVKFDEIGLEANFVPEIREFSNCELVENAYSISDINTLIEVDASQILVTDESTAIDEDDGESEGVIDAIVYYEPTEAEPLYEECERDRIYLNIDPVPESETSLQIEFDDRSQAVEHLNENEIEQISNSVPNNKKISPKPKVKSSKKSKCFKTFQCDTCGAVFDVYAEYNKHKKSHGNKRYQCATCERWFAKRHHLIGHNKTHNGLKLFECTMCQKRYTNQGNLDRHIKVFHRKERRHVCSICGSTFSQVSILRQHQSVHITERTFNCDFLNCGKKFKTSDHLKMHKFRHLPAEERPKRKYAPSKKKYKMPKKISVCNICGKRTKTIASHMKTHSDEKRYQCPHCKKRFNFHQSLKNHIFLHTGEKRFKCNECDMSFRQVGHLQGHKLVHSGVKKHACTVCGKAFALKSNLHVHMRIHTSETFHHCTICSKKFYNLQGLRRHLLLHEEKNHEIINSGEFTSLSDQSVTIEDNIIFDEDIVKD